MNSVLISFNGVMWSKNISKAITQITQKSVGERRKKGREEGKKEREK